MIKCILLLLACVPVLGQRTPFYVNGSVVSNPNLKDVPTLSWSVNGSNITAAINLLSTAFSYSNISPVLNMTASTKYDAYTIPNGYRAVFSWSASTTNTSPTIATVYAKLASAYFPISRISSLQDVNSVQANGINAFILESGDVLSCSADFTGANVFLLVQLFSTNVPFRTIRLTNVLTGVNTIYTAPASSIACRPFIFGASGFFPESLTCNAVNDSGISVTYAGALDSVQLVTNKVVATVIASTSTTALFNLETMASGRSLIVNSSTNKTGQLLFVTVYEPNL